MRLAVVWLYLSAAALQAQAHTTPITTIPLRMDPLAHVEVSINGTAATLILDTGAGGIVIDTSLANAAGLRMRKPFTPTRDGEGVSDSVRIGDLLFRDEPVTVKSFAALGPRIVGVVGTSVLKRYVARIDVSAGEMKLFDNERFAYDGSGTILPIEFVEEKPRTRVTLERVDGKRVEAQLYIDLGAGNSVIGLTPAFADRAGIGNEPGAIEIIGARTLDGQGMDRITRLPRASLGALTLNAPLVTVSTGLGAALTPKKLADGVVGLQLLSRTVLILDYARRRIILEPKPGFAEHMAFQNVNGMQLARQGNALVVRHVIKASPAADAGVRVGDEIVSVDDEAITPTTPARIPRLTEAGTTHRVTIRRAGVLHTVTIALRELL